MSEVGSLIVNVLLALPPFPSPESSPLLFLTLPYNKRMEINLCGISTGCGLLIITIYGKYVTTCKDEVLVVQ